MRCTSQSLKIPLTVNTTAVRFKDEGMSCIPDQPSRLFSSSVSVWFWLWFVRVACRVVPFWGRRVAFVGACEGACVGADVASSSSVGRRRTPGSIATSWEYIDRVVLPVLLSRISIASNPVSAKNIGKNLSMVRTTTRILAVRKFVGAALLCVGCRSFFESIPTSSTIDHRYRSTGDS